MRCCGAAVLRCCGAAVLRCCGAAVLRCCGAAVLRCSGAAVLRCCGAAVLHCFARTCKMYHHCWQNDSVTEFMALLWYHFEFMILFVFQEIC